MRHGPCLKTPREDPGFRNKVPELTFHILLGVQDRRLGAERDQVPYGPTGTASGNCQLRVG